MATTVGTICADCGAEASVTLGARGQAKTFCEDCQENWVVCDNCGEVVKDSFGYGNEYYCQECFDELFATCESCGETVALDDLKSAENGTCYCQSCYDENYFCCENCGHEVSRDRAHTDANGNDYCGDCYCDLFTSCESCGCELDREQAIYRNDCDYCESCAPSEETWDAEWFYPSPDYVAVGSRRRFGVELETSECPNHTDIAGETLFGCKEDGSIDGMEFVSPILSSDKGLAEIAAFCRLSERFSVDEKCGFHLHLDMDGEPLERVKSVAIAYLLTQEVWHSFCPANRRDNHYCAPISWAARQVSDCASIYDMAELCERYHWLNLCSLACHRTIEIRLHSSTLDETKICNWVKAHTRFADWAARQSAAELAVIFSGSRHDRFYLLAEIIGEDLAAYYRQRAAKFGVAYTSRQAAA